MTIEQRLADIERRAAGIVEREPFVMPDDEIAVGLAQQLSARLAELPDVECHSQQDLTKRILDDRLASELASGLARRLAELNAIANGRSFG